LGSLSVSDVQDDDGEKGGSGDTERETIGVDEAVEDTDERPDIPCVGSKKSGPVELCMVVKVARDLGCECEAVLTVSGDSLLEELS